jgi:hypothetical protein
MAKKIKQPKPKKVVLPLVTSKDTKDALKMSFGEYMDTNPEVADRLLGNLVPNIQVFQDMANRVNEQMKSLGVLDRLRDFQLTYQNILKDVEMYKFSPNFLVAPPMLERGPISTRLSSEDIDAIAKRSVEILSAKLDARFSSQPAVITLVLTAEGDLCRNDDRTKCYSMRDSGLRLQIVRALIGQKGFRPSKELRDVVQSKSYASLTEAIRSINKKAEQFLNLPAYPHRFIISKSHSGYMINPMYPIIAE